MEWGVFTLAAHSGRRLAAGRLAPTVRLHAFHRSPTNGARNLLHIAPSSLWSTPYSCGPLSGRVIRSRSLQAHLGKKSPLEWDLMHYAGHRPGRLAALSLPIAHSLPLSRHILRNTHLRALSLQQGPSRAARRRRASTRIFAIFDHSHCMKDMVRNRSEKFRDTALVTTQNCRPCSGSAPPRLFASHLSSHDRMHSSSRKIFRTVPLCTPALLTQPQRRNTDVRGRSYHVLKLFTPRQKPDSAGFGDTPRFGGVGRKWATHFVCNLSRRISDFPFFSPSRVSPRQETKPGPGR